MPIVDDFLLKRSPDIPLSSNEENRTDLALTQAADQTGNVRGRVTNSQTGEGVDGATIKIRTQSGTPIMHTTSNPSGNYSLQNIAPGTYSINAALKGYNTTNGRTFTVIGGQNLNIDISMTPRAVLNTLYGTVTDLATGEKIEGVVLALLPDLSTTANVSSVVTNFDGQYLIGNIVDGTPTLFAFASGYYSTSALPLEISGGIIVNTDISLQPYTLPGSTVNGYIVDQDGKVISNACVGLYKLNGNNVPILQQVTYTDSTGFYIFGRVTEGTFVVKAKSEKIVEST